MNNQYSLNYLVPLLLFAAITGTFWYASFRTDEKQQPRNTAAVKIIDGAAPCRDQIVRAFFSPDDSIEHILIDLIDAEKKAIEIAIYTFTSKKLADALIRAMERGIAVTIYADGGKATDNVSRIALLRARGATLWLYPSGTSPETGINNGILHYKTMIFSQSIGDVPLIATGSYNFTRSANDRNQENIIITTSPQVIADFRQQFIRLKERSTPATTQKPFKYSRDKVGHYKARI